MASTALSSASVSTLVQGSGGPDGDDLRVRCDETLPERGDRLSGHRANRPRGRVELPRGKPGAAGRQGEANDDNVRTALGLGSLTATTGLPIMMRRYEATTSDAAEMPMVRDRVITADGTSDSDQARLTPKPSASP